MSTRILTCIVCPRSCRITVEDGGAEITGYGCRRGLKYAEQEIREPRRMLTTTVTVRGGILPRLPVVSSADIPRRLFPACLAELARVVVDAPVAYGQVIVKDIAGTGVDIVAARELAEKVG
ncbi:MAG TPA: DUF1667 domain-containing protein [Firmicutes bacterium]|uniref:DUF1667 domain-containing protein n=1 Tax=Gelria sp. Kuro-4 TaxID=2796927 RepID=UPI00198A6928|nr:DUF1667 domain-containing protein [Gelria sp. Kuro-4]MDI3522847.1 hypothetical protein [Bacillota bacterium]MDK2926317.1 hypothetical protein [Bacillota bacterium]BCV24656.1 molybdopterin oxidoreductase [Gelria sp. Kuro-4]HHV56959.1 DUF1667 domain-containing protein [Bacillota bacterium]